MAFLDTVIITATREINQYARTAFVSDLTKKQCQEILEILNNIKNLTRMNEGLKQEADNTGFKEQVKQLLPLLPALPFLLSNYILEKLSQVTDFSLEDTSLATLEKQWHEDNDVKDRAAFNDMKLTFWNVAGDVELGAIDEIADLFAVFEKDFNATSKELTDLFKITHPGTITAIQKCISTEASGLTHPLLRNFREALILKVEQVFNVDYEKLILHLAEKRAKYISPETEEDENGETIQLTQAYRKVEQHLSENTPTFFYDIENNTAAVIAICKQYPPKISGIVLGTFTQDGKKFSPINSETIKIEKKRMINSTMAGKPQEALSSYLKKIEGATSAKDYKLLVVGKEWNEIKNTFVSAIQPILEKINAAGSSAERAGLLLSAVKDIKISPAIVAHLFKQLISSSNLGTFIDSKQLVEYLNNPEFKIKADLSNAIFDFYTENQAVIPLHTLPGLGASKILAEWQKNPLDMKLAKEAVENRHLTPALQAKLLDNVMQILLTSSVTQAQDLYQSLAQKNEPVVVAAHLPESKDGVDGYEEIDIYSGGHKKHEDDEGEKKADAGSSSQPRRMTMKGMKNFAMKTLRGGNKAVSADGAEVESPTGSAPRRRPTLTSMFTRPKSAHLDLSPASTPTEIVPKADWKLKSLDWLKSDALVEDLLALVEKLDNTKGDAGTVRLFTLQVLHSRHQEYKANFEEYKANMGSEENNRIDNDFVSIYKPEKVAGQTKKSYAIDVKFQGVVYHKQVMADTYTRAIKQDILLTDITDRINVVMGVLKTPGTAERRTYDPAIVEFLGILLDMWHPAYELQSQTLKAKIDEKQIDADGSLALKLTSATSGMQAILAEDSGIKKLQAHVAGLKEVDCPLTANSPLVQDLAALQKRIGEFQQSIQEVKEVLNPKLEAGKPSASTDNRGSNSASDGSFSEVSEGELDALTKVRSSSPGEGSKMRAMSTASVFAPLNANFTTDHAPEPQQQQQQQQPGAQPPAKRASQEFVPVN